MLKILGSIESLTWPEDGIVGVGSDSRVGRDGSKLDGSEINDVKIDGGKIGNEVEKKGQKMSKSKKTLGSLDFLTLGAKLVFTKLRQVFFKALIFHHFDLEYHIRIETDVSDHAISRVLSQLTLDNLG